MNCEHKWGKPEYTPDYKKETYVKGVINNKCGMFPIEDTHTVEIPHWKRVCKKCGVVEYTTKYVTTRIPVFPENKG